MVGLPDTVVPVEEVTDAATAMVVRIHTPVSGVAAANLSVAATCAPNASGASG
jgi:hypothetical protein